MPIIHNKMKIFRIILSIPFLVVGSGLLVLLTSSSMGGNSSIAKFLFSSYSYMAYAIPLFYFWIFIILFSGKQNNKRLVWPLVSLIPFFVFTIGLKLQLFGGQETNLSLFVLDFLKQIFGDKNSGLAMYILGVSIILGEILFYSMSRNNIDNIEQSIDEIQKQVQRVPVEMKIPQDVPNTIRRQYHNDNYNASNLSVMPTNAYSPQIPPPIKTEAKTKDTLESHVLIFNKKKSDSDINKKNIVLFNSNESNDKERNNQHSQDEEEEYKKNVYEYQDLENQEFIITPEEKLQDTPIDTVEESVMLTDESDIMVEVEKQGDNSSNTLNDDSDISVSIDDCNTFDFSDFSEDDREESNENESDSIDRENFQENNVDIEDSIDIEDFQEDSEKCYETDTFENEIQDPVLGNSHENIQDISSITQSVRKPRGTYKIPIIDILDPPENHRKIDEKINEKIGRLLEITLDEFNIDAKIIAIFRGPVVTMFEILPAPGVRLSRIEALNDNIALRLAAPSVRIIAPIPGKEAVGIEVPNKEREIVLFSELITAKQFQKKENVLPIALGKNITDDIQIADLSKTPHLLIAGSTGSGKSVCINSIICSLLYRCTPDEIKLILIDPKIVELSFYNGIRHLLTPVISDATKSLQALRWCVAEMERRYQALESLNVREIRNYNRKLSEKGIAKKSLMPFIVVVIDEFADLMMTCGKEIESLVARLTAKSRSVGIHLVIATQRPSTDVITGLIKSNIPTRISFMVTSKTDSRIILDMNGAENLLGRGDMLYSSASDPFPERLQGPYLSEDEVQRVVDYVKDLAGEPEYVSDEIFMLENGDNLLNNMEEDDPLWDVAVEEVIHVRKASASHLQRRFKIGYNRAARLVEEMEERGIIGPQQGSKPREVYTDAV